MTAVPVSVVRHMRDVSGVADPGRSARQAPAGGGRSEVQPERPELVVHSSGQGTSDEDVVAGGCWGDPGGGHGSDGVGGLGGLFPLQVRHHRVQKDRVRPDKICKKKRKMSK